MASYFDRPNGTVTARVRMKGHPPMSKTFQNKTLAKKWAEGLEGKVKHGTHVDFKVLSKTDVASILRRFRDEICPNRDHGRWETNTINRMLGVKLMPSEEGAAPVEKRVHEGLLWTYLMLDQDIAGGLKAWRDEEIKRVLPQTFNRTLSLVSTVFTHAQQEWHLRMPVNPCTLVKKPAKIGGERDFTWTHGQVKVFSDYVGWSEDEYPKNQRQWAAWALNIGMATGLRRGQMVSTEVAWIDEAQLCIHYPPDVVKNREKFDLTLEDRGLELILKLKALRKGHVKLFGVSSPDCISVRINEVRKELVEDHPDLVGMRLHDTRHTYTTELVDLGLSMAETMKIMGRRSHTEMLRYYNPKPKDMSAKVSAARAAARAKRAAG